MACVEGASYQTGGMVGHKKCEFGEFVKGLPFYEIDRKPGPQVFGKSGLGDFRGKTIETNMARRTLTPCVFFVPAILLVAAAPFAYDSRSMHTTPPSLLQRLRDPAERQAWNTFVELYTPLLFVWSRRWGLQDSDAADLVQDVLLLLYQKLPEFDYDRGGSFRGWLRTVLLNKWRDSRRRQHPPGSPLAKGGMGGAGDLVDPAVEPSWAEQEEQEYRQQLLRVMLKKLQHEFPATIWAAFEAYVVQGQAPIEVATNLQISPATVYAAKSKVFQRLRQELAGMLE